MCQFRRVLKQSWRQGCQFVFIEGSEGNMSKGMTHFLSNKDYSFAYLKNTDKLFRKANDAVHLAYFAGAVRPVYRTMQTCRRIVHLLCHKKVSFLSINFDLTWLLKTSSRVFRADGRLVNISEFFVQTIHKLTTSFQRVKHAGAQSWWYDNVFWQRCPSSVKWYMRQPWDPDGD